MGIGIPSLTGNFKAVFACCCYPVGWSDVVLFGEFRKLVYSMEYCSCRLGVNLKVNLIIRTVLIFNITKKYILFYSHNPSFYIK